MINTLDLTTFAKTASRKQNKNNQQKMDKKNFFKLKTGECIAFDQEPKSAVDQYKLYTTTKKRNVNFACVRKVSQIVSPNVEIDYTVVDLQNSGMKFQIIRNSFSEIESLDTNAEKYGKKSKKPNMGKRGSASAKSNEPEKRLATYTIITFPCDLAGKSSVSEARKELATILDSEDKVTICEDNLAVKIKAYGHHHFPSTIPFAVAQAGTQIGIWSTDADVAGAPHLFVYINMTPQTKKITFIDATKTNTPTLSDINLRFGRRKRLLFLSECAGNGDKFDEIKQLLSLTGAPSNKLMQKILSNQQEMMKLLHELSKQIGGKKPVAHIVDLSSPTPSVDIPSDKNKSKSKGKSKSKIIDLLNNDEIEELLPKFKTIAEIPATFKDNFFNGYILVEIYGDGNCLMRFFEKASQILGLNVSHSQFRTLLHAQIQQLQIQPNPELPAIDTMLQNIQSAGKSIDIILKDGNYVDDDYMDMTVILFSHMFKCNILPYKDGKLRIDLLTNGIGFVPANPCAFGVFTGSHWRMSLPKKLYQQICPEYVIICELGDAFPDKFIVNKCGGCFKVISKKNKSAFMCIGDEFLPFNCEYMSGVHKNCAGKVVDDPLELIENPLARIKCNVCLGTSAKEWKVVFVEDSEEDAENDEKTP
eukprot:315135_1